MPKKTKGVAKSDSTDVKLPAVQLAVEVTRLVLAPAQATAVKSFDYVSGITSANTLSGTEFATFRRVCTRFLDILEQEKTSAPGRKVLDTVSLRRDTEVCNRLHALRAGSRDHRLRGKQK